MGPGPMNPSMMRGPPGMMGGGPMPPGMMGGGPMGPDPMSPGPMSPGMMGDPAKNPMNSK